MLRARRKRSASERRLRFAKVWCRRLRGTASRCMRFARRGLEAVPPVAAAVLLVALQLLAAAALGQGQGWSPTTRDKVLAAVLLAVQAALVYAVVLLVAGRIPALFAGLVLVLGPVVLARRYFGSGGGTPPIDYRTVYRHDVLPTAFGLTARSGLIAACLLLASAWLVLARTRYLLAIVPGVPVYWLLTACIPFLVPRVRRQKVALSESVSET